MALGNSSQRERITWKSVVQVVIIVILLSEMLIFKSTDPSRRFDLVTNTFLLAIGTCLISLPLGTAVAILVAKTNLPGRRFVALLFATLLFVPILFQAAAWHAGFGKLSWFTFTQGSLDKPILSGWTAAIWIHAMTAIPWVMLIVGLGLRQVEPELEEEALLDGSMLQVFFRVTIARVMAPMLVAALWIFVMTAGEITVTDLCAVRTVAEEMYQPEVSANDPVFLVTIAAMMIVLSLTAVMVVVARLAPATREGTLRQPWTLQLAGGQLALLGLLLALIVFAVVVVPLASLIYQAGSDTVAIGDTKVKQWSIDKLVHMLTTMPVRYADEFGWTAVIGVAAATTALLIALPLAWWLARGGGVFAWPAFMVVTVCCALPSPLVGLGLLFMRDVTISESLRDLFDYSIFAPTVACVVRCLPITVMVLWYSVRTIGTDQFASSSTEGAGPARQIWDIAIRQRIAAIGVAWLIAFALASGDLSASILTMPAGIDTIPRAVFGKLHSGVDDQAAAICLVCLAGFLAIGGVVILVLNNANSRRLAK